MTSLQKGHFTAERAENAGIFAFLAKNGIFGADLLKFSALRSPRSRRLRVFAAESSMVFSKSANEPQGTQRGRSFHGFFATLAGLAVQNIGQTLCEKAMFF